jgi:hypothetical protein
MSIWLRLDPGQQHVDGPNNGIPCVGKGSYPPTELGKSQGRSQLRHKDDALLAKNKLRIEAAHRPPGLIGRQQRRHDPRLHRLEQIALNHHHERPARRAEDVELPECSHAQNFLNSESGTPFASIKRL